MFALLLLNLAMPLVILHRNAGIGLMIPSIAVTNVPNAIPQKPTTKNGKESVVRKFATQFSISAAACIRIQLIVWKEQTMQLIAAIHVWSALLHIALNLKIRINVHQNSAMPFMKAALKTTQQTNVKKLQMMLLTAVRTVRHAKQKKLNIIVTQRFAPWCLMSATAFTHLTPAIVRREPMSLPIVATIAWIALRI